MQHNREMLRRLIDARDPSWRESFHATPRILMLEEADPACFVIQGTAFGAGHLLGNRDDEENGWQLPHVGFCIRGAAEEARALLEAHPDKEYLTGYIHFRGDVTLSVTGVSAGIPEGAKLVLEALAAGEPDGFCPVELFLSTHWGGDPQPRVRALRAETD